MGKQIMEIFETMEYGPVLESASQARSWLQEQQPFQLFIGGQWSTPVAGHYADALYPVTGEVLASVAVAEPDDVEQAVASAVSALSAWGSARAQTRARYLYALSRHIQQHAALLALLETLDSGRVLRESRGELAQAARVFSYYAGQAQLAESVYAGELTSGVVVLCATVAQPFLQLVQQLAPVLAAGNTVVIKPARHASLAVLKFAEIVQAVDLPAGVVNVLTGDDDTLTQVLTSHTALASVVFSGTKAAGSALRKRLVGSGTNVQLSVVTRTPFVVFEDADLDSVVEGVVDAAWSNQGSLSAAATNLLVQENVATALVGKLRARIETLRSGDPLDRTTDLSSIIPDGAIDALPPLLAQASKERLQYWQPSWAEQGTGFPPTIFFDVAPASQLTQSEIPGPALLVSTFRDLKEALGLLGTFGNGQTVSIWSENINVALDAASQLKVEAVWINSVNLQDSAVALNGTDLYDYTRPAWLTGEALSAATAGHTQNKQTSGGSLADLRSAVAAAKKASSWSERTTQARAQVLYALAENLAVRETDFAQRIAEQTGRDHADAIKEVQASIARLFSYAAWAETFAGSTRRLPEQTLVMETVESLGIIGVVTPDAYPLLGLISLIAPAIAMGNTVVAIPARQASLVVADLYPLLESAHVPAGVINIVTGDRDVLSKDLAGLRELAAFWYCGSAHPDWFNTAQSEGRTFLRAATRIKHIWLPYGA